MASTPWLIAQDLMGGWWKFRPSTKAVLLNRSCPFLPNLLGRNERSGTGYWVLYAGEEILLKFGWGMNPHIFPSTQSLVPITPYPQRGPHLPQFKAVYHQVASC
ncbi:MAG: hypothetical protein V7K64_28430 [Nostoc sp.]|uniref:hypothetical protein n=1 Tax=Nostoc sp. TaxID=1180 RepID=UPI002FFC27D0